MSKKNRTQQHSNVKNTTPTVVQATVNNTNVVKDTDATTNTITKIFPWILTAIIVAISFLLYTNTFNHRYVLDDHGIVQSNKITKAPVSWDNTVKIFTTPHRKGDNSDLENSLYRPFCKLLFNIEWHWFNEQPSGFHKMNVVLYALCCGLLFFVLYDAFNKKWIIAFLVSLLFAIHPVHTEVVANIKSMDEILSMLGVLIALRGIQLYIRKNSILYLLVAVLGFLIGLFSKEGTVVFVAIIPLFLYYFYSVSLKKNITLSSVFALCTAFFLLCRQNALVWELKKLGTYKPTGKVSALDNYMSLCTDGFSKFASAVATLGNYIKLFFVPYPLSCDYSYKTFEPITMADPKFILCFMFFIGLLVFTIITWRKKNAIAFGVLWFFISIVLVSNVFFLIGSSFSDRFLFIPSLGLALSFVCLLYHYFYKDEQEYGFLKSLTKAPVLFGVVLLMCAIYSFKTYERNEDWRTDYKLFSTDLVKFPDATHLLFYLGNHLSSSEYTEGKTPQESKQANYDAIANLSKSLSIYPALPSDGYNQLGKAYFNIGKLDSAQKYYAKALTEDSTNGIFINNMGTVYYNTNRLAESFPYFVKAHLRDSTESDFMNNIGCVYGATQRPDSAIYWFLKANAKDSLDLTSLGFLDITYRAIGQIELANYYKSRQAAMKMIREQNRLENQ